MVCLLEEQTPVILLTFMLSGCKTTRYSLTQLLRGTIWQRKRFLDDIFQEWYGTKAELEMSINKVGIELGFTVKGDCGKTIEFN